MIAARLHRLTEQQSGIARKVLDATPIQEAWTSRAILTELGRHGTRVDVGRVEGCLYSLKDQGLVRELHPGEWQRVVATEAPERDIRETNLTHPDIPDVPPKEPLSRLADAAAELRARGEALIALADEIDAAALAMEERVQSAGTDGKKLRQLQTLLREIGGGA